MSNSINSCLINTFICLNTVHTSINLFKILNLNTVDTSTCIFKILNLNVVDTSINLGYIDSKSYDSNFKLIF